jgi:hypothetical protein
MNRTRLPQLACLATFVMLLNVLLLFGIRSSDNLPTGISQGIVRFALSGVLLGQMAVFVVWSALTCVSYAYRIIAFCTGVGLDKVVAFHSGLDSWNNPARLYCAFATLAFAFGITLLGRSLAIGTDFDDKTPFHWSLRQMMALTFAACATFAVFRMTPAGIFLAFPMIAVTGAWAMLTSGHRILRVVFFLTLSFLVFALLHVSQNNEVRNADLLYELAHVVAICVTLLSGFTLIRRFGYRWTRRNPSGTQSCRRGDGLTMA